MRLLKAELKRILKSSRSMGLIAIGICLSVLLAVVPVLFVSADIRDAHGNVRELNGISAIRYWREIYKPFDGVVTPEKLKSALTTYQDCVKKYGNPNSESFPPDVYIEKIAPIYSLLRLATITYDDFVNGNLIPRGLEAINVDELDSFYQECDTRLQNVLTAERETAATIKKATELYGKVERPFTLHAGYTRDAFDYLTINTLFFVLFGVVFSAPLFSENYETGADHILRCTKFGRKKLARTKILAHMLMNILMYLIGITLHLIISDLAFGTSTLKTSVQALYDTISLPNMNLFQLQITVSLAGMLSLIAGNAFKYFVSAKQERVAGTLSLSLLFALAPTFIFMGLGNNWLSAILPTGGVGMNNSLLNQLVDFRFLHLGSHSFWTPQVTLLFTIIWIPVFLFLAIRSYSKHQVA